MQSIGEPSSRARAKFGSQFIVAAPEGQKVPVRLFGRNHARDWPDQMTARNSLHKAHSVQSEVPVGEGLTRVSAVAAARFERRRVKSVNAGGAARSINERLCDNPGAASDRLPIRHATRHVINALQTRRLRLA